MNQNLFALLESRITQPSKPFIQTPSGGAFTYGDMLETSGRFASVLAELGVSPGDRVAVQVEKSPEALLLYLGCLRAGAVYLPLNTGYTGAELSYFLNDASPKVFVCPSKAEREAMILCNQSASLILKH